MNTTNCYTIKCKYVFKRPNGTWNICKNKSYCRYAHSIKELRCLQCNLDSKCSKYNNKGICMYKHTSETRDEWISRTNMYRPELPLTNDTIYHNDTILNQKLTKHNKIPIELDFIENISDFVSNKVV